MTTTANRFLFLLPLLFYPVATGLAQESAGAQQRIRNDGARIVEIPLNGSLQNAASSPDSSSLLFTRWRKGYNGGKADLFVSDLRSRKLRELVSNNWANVNLNGSSWNAKTYSIVLASDREPHDEIYMIAADGRNGDETRTVPKERISGLSIYRSVYFDKRWLPILGHLKVRW